MSNFFTRLFEVRSNENVQPDVSNPVSLPFKVGNYFKTNNALKLSTVYRCVEVISDALAQLPLEPYVEDEDGHLNKQKQHPSYALLNKRPNEVMSRYTFIKLIVTSILLKGNAYAYIERDNRGNAKALHYIPADNVTVKKPSTLGVPPTYTVNGFARPIESCNMLHFLGYTDDGYEGISVIQHAVRTLQLASSAENQAVNFFQSGASSSGILTASTRLRDEQKKEIRESFNQVQMQSDGHGVIICDADLKYSPITVNPADAQLLQSREFSVIEICRFFGVSPTKVGDLSKSSYSTIEASQLAFLTDTIAPFLDRIELEFERKLYLPSERDTITVKFDAEQLLRGDMNAQSNYYAKMFNIGCLTINEIRSKMNLPHIENGDKSFVQVNIQTLDRAVTAPVVNEQPMQNEDKLTENDDDTKNNSEE